MMDTEKVFDILEEKNEIEDAEDAEELYECRGDIDFENGESNAFQWLNVS